VYQVEFNSSQKNWQITCLAELLPGYDFVIFCPNQDLAEQISFALSFYRIRIPTMDTTPFIEITDKHRELNRRVFIPVNYVVKWDADAPHQIQIVKADGLLAIDETGQSLHDMVHRLEERLATLNPSGDALFKLPYGIARGKSELLKMLRTRTAA
jgi:hypothetical protein